MAAGKKSVTTPLHLLQQLSHSLVAHLEKACSEAQGDTEALLAKLEKQRGKAQEKLIKARTKLDETDYSGKSKAQAKAHGRLAELDEMLAVLQARQSETLNYLSELKRDAEQSLKLAQGITEVEKAAAQALATREKPVSTRVQTHSKAPVRADKPVASKAAPGSVSTSSTTASRAKPAARTNRAVAKSVETQASATKASSASRRPASIPAPTAEPGSAEAKSRPAAAKKPAARKRVAGEGETATQPSAT